MSAYDSHRVLTRNGRPGLVTKLIAAFLAWNDARVTRAALMKLSDRELQDIGLNRWDIDRAARG